MATYQTEREQLTTRNNEKIRIEELNMATGTERKTTGITAVVLGASGSSGKNLCMKLAESPSYESIVTINRRELHFAKDMKKIKQILLSSEDIRNPSKLREATQKACIDARATHAFSTLGIGTKTGSVTLDQHRAIDVELNRAFALGCADSKTVRSFVLLSSVGADPTADENGFGTAGGARYLRVKGDMEEAVKSSKINSVYLIRPAMIKGSRNTPGILECMEPCCWFACCLCLCLPSRFHSIRIEDMARAMTLAGLMEKKGVFVLEYDEMKALFDPNP